MEVSARKKTRLADIEQRVTSVACSCGKVRVIFAPATGYGEAATSKWRNECCCVDCYQKVTRSKGFHVPAVEKREQPVEILSLTAYLMYTFVREVVIYRRYFMNRMHVTGKEHLKFSKLRDDAMTINMTAACCDTLLCGQSTRYHGNAVCTWPCAARFSSPLKHGGDPFDVTRLRCWIADWPKAKYEKLWSRDKVPGWFMVRDKVHYHGAGAQELYDHFRHCLLFGPADEWPGESFEDLLAATRGGEVECLDLPEGAGSFRSPSVAPRHLR